MVNTADFYKHTTVLNDPSNLLGKRIRSLLDEVVERLPDEEQFKMKGAFLFAPKEKARQFWQEYMQNWGSDGPNFAYAFYGECSWSYISPTISEDMYFITILVDYLDSETDDYIKGIIAHELAEMSLPFRKMQENWDSLKKMKLKARQVKMDQLTSAGVPGSKEWQKHEEEVDNEARRLGFQKEIDALNASKFMGS